MEKEVFVFYERLIEENYREEEALREGENGEFCLLLMHGVFYYLRSIILRQVIPIK